VHDKPDALKFDLHHGTWRPFRGDLPGQARRLDIRRGHVPFGAGFTRIDRGCQIKIQPASDQVLYVISGEIAVVQADTTALVAHSGDVLMLRAGARLALDIVGHCHFFYVLAPDVDWRESLSPTGALNPINGDKSW
jgi:uncharacterized cupin superfamily protein